MGRIVALHSFRGGTGKSNITANLAYLLALRGRHVAVLDTDIQSPGVHLILGLDPERITFTLSDAVLGKCDLEDAAYDLRHELQLGPEHGRVLLLPSSMAIDDISRVLAEGYDANKLNRQFKRLLDTLKLDFLILDTHPGLNRETLLTTSISDLLLLLIRPDKQDYHGTAVLVEVARRLQVPRIGLLVNKVLQTMDWRSVREKVEQAYEYDVLGMLPLDEALVNLGSRTLFAMQYPTHPWTAQLSGVADKLLEIIPTT
jgi:MinD-like ATPase involved in chromosome partitioning or flagellar assembly